MPPSNLRERTYKIACEIPVFDLHTHLVAPCFGTLNLWGIDEILTYHYLIAEFLRVRPDVSGDDFYSWSKSKQADEIWVALFVERTPVSEAQAGVVTIIHQLGFDPEAVTLEELRAHFRGLTPEEQIDRVLQISGVSKVVMTNDPKDPVERAIWDGGYVADPRFLTVLRLDQILATGNDQGDRSVEAIRSYLGVWIERMKPVYVAISLPETWTFAEATLIREAVLPACREHDLPFAMMIGVRRGVNPSLRGAGDGSGLADLTQLELLLQEHLANKFLVTTLAKENAHTLAVMARKFSNLMPFGCWWFVNNPSIIAEITDFRLEMLGTSFIPQHSDARVLEHLIYKWDHSRRIISKRLAKRYEALDISGYAVTDDQIRDDLARLLHRNAEEFLGVS
ncbi:MAG: hypothetical protein QE269_02155 [Fimbriimonas sp.]|nr:hypothetical protein [Fimbriimonas sp.]